jgi:endonuclease/exonuclease/phosphatase family metal-dependent hydrolase
MADLKLVVWNVEWVNDLFEPGNGPAAFRPDATEPQHSRGTTVLKRRQDLSGVLNELALDVAVLVEAPSRSEELQLFFDQDVEGTWQAIVQRSPGQAQNVGIAVRLDQGKFASPALTPTDTGTMAAFAPFLVDVDDDGIDEQYRFERRPLYVEVHPAGGQAFQVLGLHLKSKGIFDSYEWSKWWQIADANRRKILAQATQLRLRFVDPLLTAAATQDTRLIVCGDINDGPGLDASEKRLFGSGVERLMGTVWKGNLCLSNALFESRPQAEQNNLDFSKLATTRFQDPIFNNVWHNEWIDHILYSANQPTRWVTNAKIHTEMSGPQPIWKKYPHASDHYPISAIVSV